ncbi:succinate dehydrogenase assembly factor 4, mitochondrial-like [Bombus flavifrons]|uniref:succinate dehydrogenase assembly factor 4, mitochondrial-like n=1 Tax=Bombus flavifrons TaxID=103934 RepID=UPI002130A539
MCCQKYNKRIRILQDITNMDILKLKLVLKHINTSIVDSINKISTKSLIYTKSKEFSTGSLLRVKEPEAKGEKKESIRMKQFHKKLKLQPIPRVPPKERFVDLVLVETDPNNGELITNSEKDPTKWGDWQNGGRVSDF